VSACLQATFNFTKAQSFTRVQKIEHGSND
jgi:hypothetical protein